MCKKKKKKSCLAGDSRIPCDAASHGVRIKMGIYRDKLNIGDSYRQ